MPEQKVEQYEGLIERISEDCEEYCRASADLYLIRFKLFAYC